MKTNLFPTSAALQAAFQSGALTPGEYSILTSGLPSFNYDNVKLTPKPSLTIPGAINNNVDQFFVKNTLAKAIKVLGSLPETTPTSLSTGSRYYIDFISGSDSNNGTSPSTPWQNLTKLVNLTLGAGTIIYIAADSAPTYNDTLADYLVGTNFPTTGFDNCGSATSTNPVIFKPYYPRGSTNAVPTLTWNASLMKSVTGYTPAWTNETAIGSNVWSIPWTFGTATMTCTSGSATVTNLNGKLPAGYWIVGPGITPFYVTSISGTSTAPGTITCSVNQSFTNVNVMVFQPNVSSNNLPTIASTISLALGAGAQLGVLALNQSATQTPNTFGQNPLQMVNIGDYTQTPFYQFTTKSSNIFGTGTVTVSGSGKALTALSPGDVCTITALGTTTQGFWNMLAGTLNSPITYAATNTFTVPANFGTGTIVATTTGVAPSSFLNLATSTSYTITALGTTSQAIWNALDSASGVNKIVSSVYVGVNWYDTYPKLYVYCTSNPATYWSNQIYAFTKGIFQTTANLRNTIFNGIGVYLSMLVSVANSSTTQPTVGLQFLNTSGNKARLFDFAQTAGTSLTASVTAINPNFSNVPSMMAKLGPTASSNFVSWLIINPVIIGGGQSYSQGACVYNQSTSNTGLNHHVIGGYGFKCLNGTGGANTDGSFAYSDISSNYYVFQGNVIEQSGVAFISNLTGNNGTISGNLAIDCLTFNQMNNSASNASQNHITVNNTWIWTGNVAAASIQSGAGVNNTSTIFSQFSTGFTIGGFEFFNNVAVDLVGAFGANGSKPMVKYQGGAITSAALAGNAAAGLGTTGLAINSTGSVDVTSTALSLVGSVADGNIWLPNPYGQGQGIPAYSSPLIGMGELLSNNYFDIRGNQYGTPPTPGCYETQGY